MKHSTGKKYLIGVTGSIACYKAFDLCRELVKAQHEVIVVLSKGALQFIKPELFKYLGVNEVYGPEDDFKMKSSNSVLHIDLARWTEHFIIYPLSANTLSKLSHGFSDDLLSSIFLSLKKNVVKTLFPAMNTEMYLNPITQKNINNLKLLENINIIAPDSGVLACGETGEGKLPLPEVAQDLIESIAKTKLNKTILINTGATISPLDPIRYLTNPSSGLTGFHLAKEFLANGYKVILISGKYSTARLDHFIQNPNFLLHRVQTTEQMYQKVSEYFKQADLYISSAAINDIEFKKQFTNKLKKTQFPKALEINQATDVLAEMIKIKQPHQQIIGFAAESEFSFDKFKNKLNSKPVDLMVANIASQDSSGQLKGFKTNEGEYFILTPDQTGQPEKNLWNKQDLAHHLVEWFQSKDNKHEQYL